MPWNRIQLDPPDVIFHVASRGIHGLMRRARSRIANERVRLALASWPRPPLVLFVGAFLAYGSQGDEWITERTPLHSTRSSCDYQRVEMPWLGAQRQNDLPVIMARTAWVLDPGSWFKAFYRQFIQAERQIPLYGTGNNWMSLIHVEDCAAFLLHAARHGLPGTTVNIFSGPPLRQLQFAERLAQLADLPIQRVSLNELEKRYGRTVRQGFECSVRMGTVHTALHETYRPGHPDWDVEVTKLLRS